MCGPARVCDPCKTSNMVTLNIGSQFGDALGAACSTQTTVVIDGDATGVIATVFEAFETFDQNGGDVARSDGANDAAHRLSPSKLLLCPNWKEIIFQISYGYVININILHQMKYNFTKEATNQD